MDNEVKMVTLHSEELGDRDFTESHAAKILASQISRKIIAPNGWQPKQVAKAEVPKAPVEAEQPNPQPAKEEEPVVEPKPNEDNRSANPGIILGS